MRRFLTIILFTAITWRTFGQTEKRLTVPQMRQDLDYTYRKLNDNHINPYLYITKQELARRYAAIRKGITQPLTRLQFYVNASELVTSLRDGHTLLEPPTENYDAYAKTGPVFPLSLMMNREGIVVTGNALESSAVRKGDQILSVNGHTAGSMIASFRMLINDVGPLYDIYVKLFNQLYWFKYGAAKSYTIRFRRSNGAMQSTVLPGVPKDQLKAVAPPGGADFTFKELDHSVGLLTFNRMFKTKEFDIFLDSTFRVIRERHIGKLVIDIRRNAGGRGKMADSLFNYLTDQTYHQYTGIKYKITQDLKNLYLSHDPNHTDPIDSAFILSQPNGVVADYLKFNHLDGIVVKPHAKANLFKGQAILLTSNQTFSGGAIIAGVFKCNGFGRIVGTEPSQSTKFVADHTYVSLPNSKLDLGISFVELHLPCEQSYYHGIQPDIEIMPKAADIKKGIDTQLQYALQVLR